MKTISQVKPRNRPVCRSWRDRQKVFECSARKLREDHRITIRQVAEATGIPTATVQRIELGYESSITYALRLAEFFETTVEQMFVPVTKKK